MMENKWKCPKCNSVDIDGVKSYTMDGLNLPGWDVWCLRCKHQYHVDTPEEDKKLRELPSIYPPISED